MVELKTIGGGLPEIPVEDIVGEDVLKVQVMFRHSLLNLYCMDSERLRNVDSAFFKEYI